MSRSGVSSLAITSPLPTTAFFSSRICTICPPIFGLTIACSRGKIVPIEDDSSAIGPRSARATLTPTTTSASAFAAAAACADRFRR